MSLSTYYTNVQLWWKWLLLSLCFLLLAFSTHYIHIYAVHLACVISVCVIFIRSLKKAELIYVAIISMLFIEYDPIVYLRLWYPIVFVYLVLAFSKFTIRHEVNKFYFFILLYFSLASIVWLAFDSLSASLSNLKVWLFYLGLVFSLCSLARNMGVNALILPLLICSAVCFLGLLQFIVNIVVGVASNPIYPNIINLEVRPVGLFSETTWLSEFALIFLVVSVFLYLKERSSFYVVMACLFILTIIVTSTRNTYLALAILSMFSILLAAINRQLNYKILKLCSFVAVICTVFLFFSDSLLGSVIRILERFANTGSESGRMEAFRYSFELIGSGANFVFGQGFYWDNSHSAGAGTSVGAKSFNVFLMIFHIYGLIGFTLFMMLVVYFVIDTCAKGYRNADISYNYSAYLFVTFICMSLFAPLHQYPPGALLLATAFMIVRKFRN